MKLTDIFSNYKQMYHDYLVYIKSGNFYITFDNDASITSYLFNYKKTGSKVGFPLCSRENVENKLREYSINYVFEDEPTSFTSNMYYSYLKKANDDLMITNMSDSLLILIKNKISDDFDNYDKINKFLNEL